ncbi:dihydrolipoamide acetyltransferase family protein [Halorubellus salinus]|uniref:dihydrolipoamide acetyltransferase family protein n=1 Tax=Halorubellus salinus TaxID=755309 RepID=UPI001D07ED91|nr:dihydrolipoamide acetyltransferase family protein [Halorubellus salinus]
MVEIVTLPKLGISDTGDLVAWEKAVGDSVEAGELLAVLESDKASAEVTAEASGTLLAIYVEEGEELEIEPGRPIAAIGDADEEAPSSDTVEGMTPTATVDDSSPTGEGAQQTAAAQAGADSAGDTSASGTEPEKMSPRARRYAREHDVALAGIEGTGPEGAVVESDVRETEAARGGPQGDETDSPAAGEESVVATTDSAGRASQAEPDDSGPAVRLTPRARRYAREHDVDPATIEGTGIDGAVTESDLRRAVEGPDAATAAPESTGASAPSGATERSESAGAATAGLTVTEERPLAGTRRTIAERLSRSAREKPHVMGTREISIETLQRARERLADRGVDVSLNDLILRAVALTLRDLPAFNGVFEDGVHSLVAERNIGYAVDTDRGLIVPVVETVDERSLSELAEHRQELVSRVLDGDHTLDDLRGGTFTVTNVGVFDLDVSYSIINPPQVAILAIGRRKPTPVQRGGDVAFETAITFSLTIDHRVLDGADTGRFLARLADYIEYPGLMLTDEL